MASAAELLASACVSGISCLSEKNLLVAIAQGTSVGGGGGGGGGTLSTDGTFAANSDLLYPSQKAAKTYIDAAVAAGVGPYVLKAGDTMTGLLTINAATSLATSGNAGFGTAFPITRLNVVGVSVASRGVASFESNNDDTFITFYGGAAGASYKAFVGWNEAIGAALFGSVGANRLSFYSNAAERLTVLPTGAVGIGIIAPLARLHITPAASGTDYFRIDHSDGTPRIQIGALTGSITYGALWFGDIVPSATNYGLASDGGTLRVGSPLAIPSGSNQRAGNATLVGGTLTVLNTTVTANTLIFLTRKTTGGTIGFAVTYTVIAATSFTITSDNVLDTSTYSYILVENP